MGNHRVEIFRRVKFWSDENGFENDNSNNPTYECYACTQVGVPVFHSSSWDLDQQPEWEATAGSSLVPIHNQTKRRNRKRKSGPPNHRQSSGCLGQVLDSRTAKLQSWNRAILLSRCVALAVDPLFFFAVSFRWNVHDDKKQQPCIYVDGGVAAIMAAVRTGVDLFHTWHLWLQFRLAYVSKESRVVGPVKLVWDPRAVASHYLRSFAGFWLDFLVILPIPQIIYFFVVQKLLKENKVWLTMAILQFIFLLQFIPKVYHSFCVMQRMRKVTGYIFGSIWWGFGLNLIVYFLASHVSGGYWYILATQRIASCLSQHCEKRHGNCNQPLSCVAQASKIDCASSSSSSSSNLLTTQKPFCLDEDGNFSYGLYKFSLPLFSMNSVTIKALYSNLWGLMALSTMGNNLEPTSHIAEVIFAIIMVLAGLMLFTLLIGNIQVFLHAIMVRRRQMQLRYRDMEWWMRHRQLPSHLKRRVRRYEHQKWETMGGQDEMELIGDLPEGLRRDIKRNLCLNLIKKVPLLCNLDNLVLDNICDRVKPLVYSKDEKIIREGDPVQKMIFIDTGHIKRSQRLSKGMKASSILEPGSFLGDELLTWCLRRPFLDRLPSSSATFTSMEPVQAYALHAEDFRYITDHFRSHFANKRVKQIARYYSSNWRTWAAVNIQFAWRRYNDKSRCRCRCRVGFGSRLSSSDGSYDNDRWLRPCAAVFMSIRPHDQLQ